MCDPKRVHRQGAPTSRTVLCIMMRPCDDARTSRSLGAVLDDALRALLRRDAGEHGHREFRLPTHGTGGLQAGVDLDDKEALAELMGDNAAS